MNDKVRYTYWVDKELWKEFQELCVSNNYKKNLVLENLIKKFIKENTINVKGDIINQDNKRGD